MKTPLYAKSRFSCKKHTCRSLSCALRNSILCNSRFGYNITHVVLRSLTYTSEKNPCVLSRASVGVYKITHTRSIEFFAVSRGCI
jgi:hypothetical protein